MSPPVRLVPYSESEDEEGGLILPDLRLLCRPTSLKTKVAL